MRMTRSFRCLLLVSTLGMLSMTGCASAETRDDPPPTQTEADAAPAPAPSAQAMPDDEVHRGAAHGEGSPAGGEDGAVYEGVVQEAMNAAGYTYLRVQLDTGDDQWVAVEASPVTVGERVSVKVSMRMTNFASKGLGRTFPSIWFGYVQTVADPSGMDDTI
jgi:outer membrane lipoprotein SlyB